MATSSPAPLEPRDVSSGNSSATKQDKQRRLFGRRQRIVLAVLGVVTAVCLSFSWASRSAMGHLSFLRTAGSALTDGVRRPIVDLNPWLTAQALAPLAVSAEEKQLAREAERQADHEVDQAFATALRLAAARQKKLTPEAKAVSDRLQQLQQVVKDDQAKLASLTASAGGGSGAAGSGPADDEIEVAKAQLGLDDDNLEDAQQDLSRAVDDESVRIQQELAAHEAAMKKYDAQAGDVGELAVISTQRNGSLASRMEAWFNQRNRKKLILEARAEAASDAQTLVGKHNSLKAKIEVGGASAPGTAGVTKVAQLKAAAAQRQLLTIYDDRIETQQELAGVYVKWAAQVAVQHEIMMHLMLQSVAQIALIGFCVVLMDSAIAYWLSRPMTEASSDTAVATGHDPRRRHTLKTILQVCVQTVGVVLALIVVFGKPEQLSTILGLATAGLTVALQSYIVAFCGWFVLMGRNGIRVGDSVEIDGVGGEVLEIGLFRTTLLETGNWTATGHPTGRRVAFMNTFAVTGRYFNFSTVGQWMWDEFTVSVPASAETYEVIETIHKAVVKETEKEARSAEEEWRSAGRQSGLSEFTASPTVNLRPAASGVDLVVRYVTRAAGRFETRNCLYQAVLEVMHRKPRGA